MESGTENSEWVKKKERERAIKIKLLLFALLPRDMTSFI